VEGSLLVRFSCGRRIAHWLYDADSDEPRLVLRQGAFVDRADRCWTIHADARSDRLPRIRVEHRQSRPEGRQHLGTRRCAQRKQIDVSDRVIAAHPRRRAARHRQGPWQGVHPTGTCARHRPHTGEPDAPAVADMIAAMQHRLQRLVLTASGCRRSAGRAHTRTSVPDTRPPM